MKFKDLGTEVLDRVGEWVEILDPYKVGDKEIPIQKTGERITITVPISWGEVIVKLDPKKFS